MAEESNVVVQSHDSVVHQRIYRFVDALEMLIRGNAEKIFSSVDIGSSILHGAGSAGQRGGFMSVAMKVVEFMSMPKAQRDALILDRTIGFVKPVIAHELTSRSEQELRLMIDQLSQGLEALVRDENTDRSRIE